MFEEAHCLREHTNISTHTLLPSVTSWTSEENRRLL